MANSPGLFTIQDIGYWDTIVQLQSSFTTTSSSLVNISGLSFSALASSKYEIEVMLALNSDDGNGAKCSVQFSAAGVTGHWINHANGGTTTLSDALGNAGLLTATLGGATSTCWFSAIIVTGVNPGNITVQVQKIVTNANIIVMKGSILKIKKLA